MLDIMDKNNVKIAVGCLLHDIGKVLFRYNDGRNHALSGADFLAKQAGVVDKDILEQVKYHHAALLKNSGVAEKSLAYISYIADNIAAAADRRSINESGSGFVRNLPLASIFNLLNGNAEHKHYQCALLDSDDIQYPTDAEICYDESFYGRCINNILTALQGIDYCAEYVNSLLAILEANLSFVPSSTSLKEVADVSLYDHMKMTAAFGGCIYQYLSENQADNYKETLFNQAEQFYAEKAFLLYSMDISGIQDFIYNISSKGALKSLRARSFYLELIMEYMADELLERVGLSRANLLYCGGGHAYVLLPNTEAVKQKMADFAKDMNCFFLQNFATELYLAVGVAQCSANELKNMPDGAYSAVFRQAANAVSACKANRYAAEEILALNAGRQADAQRECRSCRRVDLLNEDSDCAICAALKNFSNAIQTKDFFVVVTANENANLLPLPDGRYLLAETEAELLLRLQRNQNYVRSYCKNKLYTGVNLATKLWVGDYKNGDTFEELAAQAAGVERLGVLRADVDNLGQAFVHGFESAENGSKYNTVSRTATFSRKLSIFFKRHVNKLLQNGVYYLNADNEQGKRYAAVVYSGGDDVFIVGAWDDILGFAVDLHKSLSEFSQQTLSISAGIGIYPPTYPIAAMARETGILEEAAKGYPGKNAVALFDESGTYSWNDFVNGVLAEKYGCLADFFDNNDKRGKAFLYHLLEYIRNSAEKINIARFAYTLARLEPDQRASQEEKQQYRSFAKKMYQWIGREEDRKQLITAIYIYVYSIRDEQEGK